MAEPRCTPLLFGLGTSLVVHAAFGAALVLRPQPAAERSPLAAVSIEVVPPKAPPPPPPPPAPSVEEKPTESAPVAVRRKPAETAPPAPASERAPAPPAPADGAPVDLGGLLLSSNGEGSGWSPGGGEPRARPRGAATPAPTARAPRAAAPVVPAADLSRKPTPPALAALLASLYPAELRRRSIGGEAAVRARIDPDGAVRHCSVVSETEAGFGAACRRAVLGSRWGAPLDRAGRPVSTEIRYTCRFRVE
jgi:periplasmic protein TonB